MGEAAELIAAIATLVTAIGSAVAVVVTAVRTGRRERTGSAETVAKAAITDPDSDPDANPDTEQDRRLAALEERLKHITGSANKGADGSAGDDE